MHIELVDTLRCPVLHEDSWLVASVTRFDGRDVVEGMLGCPLCRRQFAVVGGVVDFTRTVTGEPLEPPSARIGDSARVDGGVTAWGSGDHEPVEREAREALVLRVRALLALDEPGGIVLLGGTHAWAAEALEDDGAVMPLVLNPAPQAANELRRVPSALRARDGLPLANGSLRAAWLDASTATPALLAGTARALRRGGRLLAPATASLPDGIQELARDAVEWVADRTTDVASSAPIPLRRR
jgi:uncharacterized protein YbaR (Trm112 family)